MKVPVFSSLILTLGLAGHLQAIERPAGLDEEGPNERPAEVEVQRAQAPEAEVGPENRGAWLGVLSETASETLSLHLGIESGVVLSYVAKDSPAERAGLQRHDVITEVDGRPVGNQETLRTELLGNQPGDEVTLGVISRGQKGERKVVLEERPADIPRFPAPRRFRGMDLPQRRGPGNVVPDLGKLPKEIPGEWKDLFGADLQKQLDQQMKDLERQLGDLERGGRLKLDLNLEDMLKNKKNLQFGFGASSTFKFIDGEGSVEMKMKDGGKEVEVRDLAGELLFEGPWDTPQDKAAAPPEIRKRIEQMDNGNRFHFRLENMPEPEMELPEAEAEELE